MKRRAFLTLLGSATLAPGLRPRDGHAQQEHAKVIGLLNAVSNKSYAARIAAFLRGLTEAGFVEGQNLAIEYRAADGDYDRLPALAGDLVRRSVAVIVCIGGTNAPRAAMAATRSIPIVFAVGNDPIESGLVASLSRPEANVTGVTLSNAMLSPKRLELLCELAPAAALLGFLLNPGSPAAKGDAADLPAAARNLGRQLVIVKAGTAQEIDAAFSAIAEQHVAALAVENDAFLNSRMDQIVGLAARYRLPAIYGAREHVARGGLISYGPDLDEMYRHAGVYAGRILNGEKPGNLPVIQPTKFELAINLKTAKALGLEVPLTLLARANEAIE